MTTLTYEVEGRPLATVIRSRVLWGGTAAPPPSYAFMCPVCGEVWARIISKGRNYMALTRPCRRHTGDGLGIPGSLWVSNLPEVVETFPTEVLRWELLRHIDWYERMNPQ